VVPLTVILRRETSLNWLRKTSALTCSLKKKNLLIYIFRLHMGTGLDIIIANLELNSYCYWCSSCPHLQ
jgi:hypothetical protein